MSDPSTLVDVAPLARDLFMSCASAALTYLSWWLPRHLQSQKARTVVMGAAENMLGWAYNRTPGIKPGDMLTVPAGSALAANMLRYLIAQVPGEAKRLGLDARGLANIVLAKLPAVDGHIDDGMLNAIVASATGTPPPMPQVNLNGADFGALAQVVAGLVKSAGDAAIAAQHPLAPAGLPSMARPLG